MSTPLSVRCQKVSSILKASPEDLLKAFADEGITDDAAGLDVLDAPTTTIDDVVQILVKCGTQAKNLQLKAAASMLKDSETARPAPVTPTETQEKMPVLTAESMAQVFKAARPIQQWSDRELLEKFVQDRDPEIETELHNKRARGQNFVVLVPGKYEPGKEKINLETTLELLKSARKRTVPSIVSNGDGYSAVYKITELNLADRIIDYCPICGEVLYKGYCEKCSLNFSPVGEKERAYINLIAQSSNFNKNSFSDRKAIMASGAKGLDDLKQTWPSLAKTFDEMDATGSLPKLRVIENRPSRTVADPFFMEGSRAFGNRSY